VCYFGLNPWVRQSGLRAAHHGRISKIGRSHARAMLVEAAWPAAKTPGPFACLFVPHPRSARPCASISARYFSQVSLGNADEKNIIEIARPFLRGLLESLLNCLSHIQSIVHVNMGGRGQVIL
jgi:hypothetical protein